MSAQYQAIGSPVYSLGTVQVAWPAHLEGDIGLLFVETAFQMPSGTFPPSGWTLIYNGADPLSTTSLYVCWKRAASSSESAALVSDSGDHQCGVIMTVRGGLETGDPIGSFAEASASSSTLYFSSIEIATTGDLFVTALARADDDANPAISYTDLQTLRFDAGTTLGNGGGLAIATRTAAAGTESSTWTASRVLDAAMLSFSIKQEPPRITSGKQSTTASCC